MSLHYTYPVSISNNRVVYCKELKYKHIIPAAKYIDSNDIANLCKYFEELVLYLSDYKSPNLTYIDKFLILMQARIKSIGSYIDLIKFNTKNSVDLKYVCSNILLNFTNISEHCKFNHLTLIYGHPVKINYIESIYNTINYIEVDGLHVYAGDLNCAELDEILANIPLEVIRKLYKIHKGKDIQPINLFEFQETSTTKRSIKFSYHPDEYINLLKLSYNIDLKTINYYQYICAQRLHISPEDFNNLTPNDVNMFIKNLQEDNKSNKNS